jgi:hypothetical protein
VASVVDLDFDMQILSRVKNVHYTNWGSLGVMTRRPAVSVKVAQCIVEWSNVENLLGLFLALLLHTNEKAAMAMYLTVENRNAQLRMIDGAAHSTLPLDHADAITVLMNTDVRPAMKYRDKLAHWNWGYTDEMPDVLLLREPIHQLQETLAAVKAQATAMRPVDVPTDHDLIYVIREPDLDRAIERTKRTQYRLRIAMGTVWDPNTPEIRAAQLHLLSTTPEIQSGLDRLREARQKNQATQQTSPAQDQSGGS